MMEEKRGWIYDSNLVYLAKARTLAKQESPLGLENAEEVAKVTGRCLGFGS
jgi:hypothetical protein